MADDSNEMATEAQLEAVELDPEKPEKRGYESLRGLRRSTYFKRSLLRMLSKAPEELETYRPRNGFETVARNMILASNSRDRSAAVAVAVFKQCQESLGEKVGVNSRPTVEERQQSMPRIINNLPCPDYSRPWNADDEKAN
jgi:hypothetical protein